jgi:hypothetical protein
MPKISPYVKFAVAYCNKMGLFEIDPITKKRQYDECDIWEGILLMHNHLNRNRNKKEAEVF